MKGRRKDISNGNRGAMRQSGLKGVLEMTEILTGIYSLMKLPVIILTHEKS